MVLLLKQEPAKRRKGRPKSIKEVRIEEPKVWEAEEYKTGLGSSLHLDEPKRIVTHLFFVPRSRGAWLDSRDERRPVSGLGPGGLQMLRYIRKFNTNSEKVIVDLSQPPG